MPELRKDPTSSRWAIVSHERSKRPGDFHLPTAEKKGGVCPFCEGNEALTPPESFSIRTDGNHDESGWKVRVVPNKFPALNKSLPTPKHDTGMYECISGYGMHEVIIDSTKHDADFCNLDIDDINNVILTYKNRIKAFKSDKNLKYAALFKNSGILAGASLEHAHSQIIAMPIIPRDIMDEINTSKQYRSDGNKCIFCDMLENEIKNKERIVTENKIFTAFCPYASRFPFEIWIAPKSHSTNFELIDKNASIMLSTIFKDVFEAYRNSLGDIPYNIIFHNSPFNCESEHDIHWHIEITPCLTYIAGFERGTGCYINPTPPEDATKALRR